MCWLWAALLGVQVPPNTVFICMYDFEMVLEMVYSEKFTSIDNVYNLNVWW